MRGTAGLVLVARKSLRRFGRCGTLPLVARFRKDAVNLLLVPNGPGDANSIGRYVPESHALLSSAEVPSGSRFDESAQPAAVFGMPQFSERRYFELTNPFAAESELVADFFERMLTPVLKSKAHGNDASLAAAETCQDPCRLPIQPLSRDPVQRIPVSQIDQKAAERRIVFFSDGSMKRQACLAELQ